MFNHHYGLHYFHQPLLTLLYQDLGSVCDNSMQGLQELHSEPQGNRRPLQLKAVKAVQGFIFSRERAAEYEKLRGVAR